MSDSVKNIVEFTLVYNRYKSKLYNYSRRMIGDRMMCEDIIQMVFIKYFENMSRIKNNDRVEAWLFTTARNAIYSFYRTKSTHVDQFGVDDADEIDISSSIKIEEEFEMKELNELILNELDKLPLEQRDVFLLKEYGGLSYKEISEAMNIDENLVKSRLHKTRMKLVNKLSKTVNY